MLRELVLICRNVTRNGIQNARINRYKGPSAFQTPVSPFSNRLAIDGKIFSAPAPTW